VRVILVVPPETPETQKHAPVDERDEGCEQQRLPEIVT
jgi:hypothetical protein